MAGLVLLRLLPLAAVARSCARPVLPFIRCCCWLLCCCWHVSSRCIFLPCFPVLVLCYDICGLWHSSLSRFCACLLLCVCRNMGALGTWFAQQLQMRCLSLHDGASADSRVTVSVRND
ncbi:hypothetical protein COO60DRAFT_1495106 [Scenedesmus sp. NREL 46B-D3]|nr:hypothetical protein COO60DRAFT_1495106 [Scenedesmus sp. NREL 46B-D3]